MREVNNSNKTVPFVNQWFDIIFLAGFPTVLIIMFLVYFLYRHLPSLLAYDYLFTALNFPHIISGLTVVYLYQQEWKEKPLQFLWLPLIFIGVITFLVLSNYKQFWVFRYYWGGLHLFIQNYCIIGLYKLRNNDNLKLDKTVDTSFLAMIHTDYVFRSLPSVIRNCIGRDTHNIDILRNMMECFLKNYWQHFILFIVIAFILRQAYLFFRYKKIYPFKILMLSAIFICYFYLLIITKKSHIALVGAIQLHNMQWIFWVWFYHRQNFKEGVIKGARIISYLSQSGRVVLYLASLMLISIVSNFFLTFRMPLNHVALIHNPIALFHFFIEIFIWKASRMRKVVSSSA